MRETYVANANIASWMQGKFTCIQETFNLMTSITFNVIEPGQKHVFI